VQGDAEPCAADAGCRQLLGDHHVETEVVGTAPAVLLGHCHAGEPVLPGQGENLARGDAGTFPIEVVGAEFFRDECGEGLPEGFVFVGEE